MDLEQANNEMMLEKISQLEKWKAEALLLLVKYDDIAESVGGELGSRKVENLSMAIKKLKSDNAKLLAACEAVITAKDYNGERWVGKLYEAKEEMLAVIAEVKESSL